MKPGMQRKLIHSTLSGSVVLDGRPTECHGGRTGSEEGAGSGRPQKSLANIHSEKRAKPWQEPAVGRTEQAYECGRGREGRCVKCLRGPKVMSFRKQVRGSH